MPSNCNYSYHKQVTIEQKLKLKLHTLGITV